MAVKAKKSKAPPAPITMTFKTDNRVSDVTIVPGESITIVSTEERADYSKEAVSVPLACARECAKRVHVEEKIDPMYGFKSVLWIPSHWLFSVLTDGQRRELGAFIADGRADVARDWAEDNGGQREWVDDITYIMTAPRVSYSVEKTFKIGDYAEHSSYNLSYFDPIKSITASNVIIDDGNGRTKRLKIEQFVWRNWDFDLSKKRQENADWRD